MYSEPQNILVIHIAGLGQTVLALPALRSLRQYLAQARITVVSSVTAADLLPLARCVDEVIAVGRFRRAEVLSLRAWHQSFKTLGEIRRTTYDLVIEFNSGIEAGIVLHLAQLKRRGRARIAPFGRKVGQLLERVAEALSARPEPFQHLAHSYLKVLEPLGVRPVEAEPKLRTDREADERIDKLFSKQGAQAGELLIGLHPGAGPGKQRWPLERFASIGARMTYNFNARVVVFAGPNERGLARHLVKLLPAKQAFALESPKLPDFVSALARLSLLVANHSGPAHVAAAVGTPVVVASTYAGPSAQDLLSKHHAHIRRQQAVAIPEEEIYEAACRLLRTNRAETLRAL
jgi:ADP-heptose:LPS heptosyltransferase